MSQLFDVNIENYTKEEIESIFELPTVYNKETVEIHAQKMLHNILSDNNTNINIKNNIVQFVNAAKQKISASSEIVSAVNNTNALLIEEWGNVTNTDKRLKPSLTIDEGNTSIIGRPPTPYINAQPGEYFPGTINPIKKRTIVQQVNIDTRFREQYKTSIPTDITIELPNKFSHVVSMELSSLQFNHTFYAISAHNGNNFFWLRLTDTTKKKRIVIPDGNYNANEFIDLLNKYIQYTDSLFSKKDSNYESIQVSYDKTAKNTGTARIIISIFPVSTTSDYITPVPGPYFYVDASGNTVVINKTPIEDETPTPDSTPFILDFQSDFNGNLDYATTLQKKMGWMLGYRFGIYGDPTLIAKVYGPYVSTYDESFNLYKETKEIDTTAYRNCANPITSKETFIEFNVQGKGTYFISEGILDISGPKYFFLVVNDFNNNVVCNNFFSVFPNSLISNNVLAKINVPPPFLSIDIPNSLRNIVAAKRDYFGPVYIQKLNIQLLNEFGTLLDINNMDFSVGLSLTVLYDL
jgi:hypothetical protein